MAAADDVKANIDSAIAAHEAADREEILRLRSLTMEERSRMIVSLCASAAKIYRSRLAAGLGEVEPDPWPESTWEFLRKQAANVHAKRDG